MGAGASVGDIVSGELNLTIVAGKDLVAKDGGMFSKASSDPFVKVFVSGAEVAKTAHVSKNLNPEWNATVLTDFIVGPKARKDPTVRLCVFDYDAMSASDPMGEVVIPLERLLDGRPLDQWFPIQPCEGCKKAKGELHAVVSFAPRKALMLGAGDAIDLNGGQVAVGMGWDGTVRNAVDVDTSCVAMGADGKVLIKETVYFAQLVNSNGAIKHSGDEREGDADLTAQGDDEIIYIDLDRVPPTVRALIIVGTVATEGKTFADLKSAKMRLVQTASGAELCRTIPALTGDSTAQFLCRLARGTGKAWKMNIIGDVDKHSRDFGTLAPELSQYMTDLVPGLVVDPNSRVAIMRKGGNVVLSNYNGGMPVGQATFGLAWDVTNGKNIDLDASAIMLDASLNVADLIFFQNLRSRDGSMQHGGDEREGDEKGDDEKIHVNLQAVAPNVKYIGFVINSYSGEELDDVSATSCHLFDSRTRRDFATYALTNTKTLDKKTALVVSMLYRDGAGEWNLRIISEAAMGKTVHDNVDELQRHIRAHPVPSGPGGVASAPTQPGMMPQQQGMGMMQPGGMQPGMGMMMQPGMAPQGGMMQQGMMPPGMMMQPGMGMQPGMAMPQGMTPEQMMVMQQQQMQMMQQQMMAMQQQQQGQQRPAAVSVQARVVQS